jgi:hypothetical protein
VSMDADRGGSLEGPELSRHGMEDGRADAWDAWHRVAPCIWRDAKTAPPPLSAACDSESRVRRDARMRGAARDATTADARVTQAPARPAVLPLQLGPITGAWRDPNRSIYLQTGQDFLRLRGTLRPGFWFRHPYTQQE